jgi:hypothetical protein
MNDYISRDNVLRKFIEGDGHDDDRFTEGYNFAVQEHREEVKKIPAADVQPVKRGRWIGIYEYCEKNGYVPSGMGIYYWCSECDKAEQKTSNFCPNCGARMDGEIK